MAVAERTDLVLKTTQGRGVLAATILGSGMASLDGTVVNVALPRIGNDLNAGLTALQWTVNAYTLTLAGLLLLGGSLGDRLGRRRVFVLGVMWFTAASIGCTIAPTAGVLIAMRALQGVGGALLTPGSLAILEAVFRREDRGAAVGAWSGLGGVATAAGPVLGGVLVGVAPWGWRLVFLINVPIAVAVIWLSERYVPETRDDESSGPLDVTGVVLAALGLAGVVFALTEGPRQGWGAGLVAALVIGVGLLVAFVVVEARTSHPLVPLSLFRSRNFTGANLATLVVYAALSGALFLLPVVLQRSAGFSPVAAGSSLLPITAVMLLLSSRMGRWASQRGPRLPMTIGPIIAAFGIAMLMRIDESTSFATDVLPALLIFGLGLSITVAPLTSTVLAAAPVHLIGVASAVNNDVARAAGLLAVAVLPGLAGISQSAYDHPAQLATGFHHAALIAAGLCAFGGLVSALMISDTAERPEEARPVDPTLNCTNCPIGAPNVRT